MEKSPNNSQGEGLRPRNVMELYIQCEDHDEMHIIKVNEDDKLSTIIDVLREGGHCRDKEGDFLILQEDRENILESSETFSGAGIAHRERIHCHRCERIKTDVFYMSHKSRSFPPSTTIHSVKMWAVREFGLSVNDASDLTLQIVGTSVKPEGDLHIGGLVKYPSCSICLELVPKKFIQG